MSVFKQKSIKQIINEYQKGTLTPLDIAKECIEASEKTTKYEAWETFDPKVLMKQAQQATERIQQGEPLRSLEGIPIAAKDIYNTLDFPTQMGSDLWKGFTPGNDARVIYYLKQAGALIAGKTVTAEFAVHELNKTLNPHDETRTPGTSSSGSAVAIALGLVPAALGTQTAASIIRPASFCGVYGYKPSFGTMPRTGMLKTTDSLDTVGCFTAFAEDLGLMFNTLRVHGPDYPIVNQVYNDDQRQNKPASRPWKVGFVKTYTWEYAENYAKQAIGDFVQKLSSTTDIKVEEAVLPEIMTKSHNIHETIYDKTLSYYFQEEAKHVDKISDIMKKMIDAGKDITIKQYHDALQQQIQLCSVMDEFMKQYDAIVCLSTAGEAPTRNIMEKPDPGLIWTLTHLPAINAPVFKSPNDLPFGLQIVARRYNDLLLLRLIDYLIKQGLVPA